MSFLSTLILAVDHLRKELGLAVLIFVTAQHNFVIGPLNDALSLRQGTRLKLGFSPMEKLYVRRLATTVPLPE